MHDSPSTTHHSPLTTHHSPRSAAFTLVEMLIAMVLTLILVTAIAQFYAIVGDSVKDGRAMIEVGGRLRSVVQKLQADLDQITVAVVPWTDDGSSSGYFEYFEGPGYDLDANNDGTWEATYSTATPVPVPDLARNGTNTNALGDGDDFVAFTARSKSGQPFTGRYTTNASGTFIFGGLPTIYTSPLAEVVWWVGFDDQPGGTALTWDLNEPRQLYRRQLLIRPDLMRTDAYGTFDGVTNYASYNLAENQLKRYWQENDISLSVRYYVDPSSGNVYYYIKANSLADLARREYRFAHAPLNITVTGGVPKDGNFPHSQQLLRQETTRPSFSSLSLKGGATVNNSYVLQSPSGNPAESPGEDILLSNLLAFDVQVYDPCMRVWPDANNYVSLTPCEPGYQTAASTAGSLTPPRLIGLGGYVDLYYYRRSGTAVSTIDNNLFTNNGYPLPWFASAPAVPAGVPTAPYIQSLGATYDTWAISYERDGIDQFGNGFYDLGMNGNDDIIISGGSPANGVDDISERETVPPYSQALRGLQVKIRVYEPSTRQVRQATVATDFVTE